MRCKHPENMKICSGKGSKETFKNDMKGRLMLISLTYEFVPYN